MQAPGQGSTAPVRGRTTVPLDALARAVGAGGLLSRPEDLMLYEYDGLSSQALPDAVVFPSSTAEVAAVVKLAAEREIPVVARGAGLSHGLLRVLL